jgi:adenylyl- and sulfurtransferase ThiI
VLYTAATVIGEKRRARKLAAQRHGSAFVRGEELSNFAAQQANKNGVTSNQRELPPRQPPQQDQRWI